MVEFSVGVLVGMVFLPCWRAVALAHHYSKVQRMDVLSLERRAMMLRDQV